MKFNFIVGMCDFITGVLLISYPEVVLQFMFIKEVPSPDVYLRYIGVFVMGTGLTYFLPYYLEKEDLTPFVWMQTSIIRFLVCFFVILQVLKNTLAMPWLIVAATDGIIAIIQMTFLIKTKK